VDDWLSAPGAQLVDPRSDHLLILQHLLAGAGTGGNLVNDAQLAAIAVEQRAEVVSYDGDFARFNGVRWRRPEELLR
jgi:predicted nucleic acid-binding protein